MDFDMYLPEVVAEPPKKKKMTKAQKRLKKLKEMEEIRKQGIRDQLQREIRLTEMSHRRGNEHWLEFCKEIKLKELRDEMEVWNKKMTMLIERKDFQIKTLVNFLDVAEQQHQRNFTKHCDFLNYFHKFFLCIIESAKTKHEYDGLEMLMTFYKELEDSDRYVAEEKMRSEKQLHATNIIVEHSLNQSFNDFLDDQYDRVNLQIEKRYIIRNETVKHMEKLQSQLVAIIKEVKHESAGRDERYDQLMERQRNFVIETANLNDAERKANSTVNLLQKKLMLKEIAFARDMRDMKHERAYFSEVYWQLKTSVQANDKATESALSILARDSFETIQKLKGYVRNGELLISLAACCRKYETEREKVMPWPDESDTVADNRISFDTNQIYYLSNDELAHQLLSLRNFWYRVSKVHTHNLLLKETQKTLLEENLKYQNIFKEMKNAGKGGNVIDTMKVSFLFGEPEITCDSHSICEYSL